MAGQLESVVLSSAHVPEYLYLYQWIQCFATMARDTRATAQEQHTITASRANPA